MMIQLIVVDEVPLSPVCQVLGLHFIIRRRPELEIL
jgi:hypothetical protein